jgi:hypothetical protein
VEAFSASLTTSAQTVAAGFPLRSPLCARLSTFSIATRTGPFFLPRYCGVSFFAAVLKISPTGALLKKG